MEIKVNTETLIQNGIGVSEYFLLYFYYHRQNLSEDYFKDIIGDNYISSLNSLQNKSFIKIDEFEDVHLRQKALDLFEEKDINKKFSEFFSTYPIKSGTRVFRTQTEDSVEAKEVKKKYLKIIKTPGEHEKIMKGLIKELELRRKENSLGFMQMITTYINQQTWEKYVDLDQEDSKPINKTLI